MISTLKSKLPQRGGFVYSVLVLMTGTSISQAMTIAILPILTRIYAPTDFGVFALFVSITSILSVIITGRYELAIMLPKEEEDSINIFVLSILIAFGLSLLSLLVVSIFNDRLTTLLGNQEISKWLYFVPLSIFFVGIYQSLNYWSIRKKQFRIVSVANISKSAGAAAISIPLGFLKLGSAGLIVGDIVGRGAAASVLGYQAWRRDKHTVVFISKEKIMENAKKYKHLPRYSTVSSFLNTLSNQTPIFLLTSFFSASITGFYSFGHRIVTVPMGLLSRSVSSVFYERASKAYTEKRDLYGLVKNAYLKLAQIGIVPFVLLFMFAPNLFAIIFGSEWREAGMYTQILIPWLFIVFLTSPLTPVITILGKLGEYVIFEILLFLSRVLSIALGFYVFDSPVVSIVLFSSVGIVFNVFLLFYLLHISNKAYAKN